MICYVTTMMRVEPIEMSYFWKYGKTALSYMASDEEK
jgi:hypothetical protein